MVFGATAETSQEPDSVLGWHGQFRPHQLEATKQVALGQRMQPDAIDEESLRQCNSLRFEADR